VSVSIGSLGKNRTTDMVENVRVDTCLLTNTTNGVRIKTWQVNTDTVTAPTHSDRKPRQNKSSDRDDSSSEQAFQKLLVCVCVFQGGMGFARDLRFESIVMKNVSNPIIIDQYYCDQPTPCANQTRAVEVREVGFADIRGTSATAKAISIACSDAVPCRDLELKNVNLTLEGGGGGRATASCYRAYGKSAGAVVPPSCLAKPTAS